MGAGDENLPRYFNIMNREIRKINTKVSNKKTKTMILAARKKRIGSS